MTTEKGRDYAAEYARRTSVELRVEIPRPWRDDLKEAAASQAVSMSDLVRMILRNFLRQQRSAAERELLAPGRVRPGEVRAE